MGFRFQKRIKVLPGVTINLSKSGASTSIGTRGAHVNIGKRGVKGTVGLPGTGISYSETVGKPEPGAADQAGAASGGISMGALLVAGIVLLFVFLWVLG